MNAAIFDKQKPGTLSPLPPKRNVVPWRGRELSDQHPRASSQGQWNLTRSIVAPVPRILLHGGPVFQLPGSSSLSRGGGWLLASWPTSGSGPAAAANINFLAQPCFSSEQLVSPFPSAISPLPFNLFYFYFSSQVLLFFLRFSLLQWPFYRFLHLSLFFSCLVLL